MSIESNKLMNLADGKVLYDDLRNRTEDIKSKIVSKDSLDNAGITAKTYTTKFGGEFSVTTVVDQDYLSPYARASVTGRIYKEYAYRVTFNGTEYELQQRMWFSNASEVKVYEYLGNLGLYVSDTSGVPGGTDNVPFIIISDLNNSSSIDVLTQTAGTYTIKVEQIDYTKTKIPNSLIYGDEYAPIEKGELATSTYNGYSLGINELKNKRATFAIGYANSISDEFSFAIGVNNINSEGYSFGSSNNTESGYAVGFKNTTNGGYVFGSNNQTDAGFAFGRNNQTDAGFAFGSNNQTDAGFAFGAGLITPNGVATYGLYNIAPQSAQITAWEANTAYTVGDIVKYSTLSFPFVCVIAHTSSSSFMTDYRTDGKWEAIVNTTDTSLIIGTGSSQNARRNGLAFKTNGDSYFSGNVYVNAGDDTSAGTRLPHDVQVNGTSVVSNGVANVPIADTSTFGAVKVGDRLAINASNALIVQRASGNTLKAGSSHAYVLTPSVQHEATFYGLASAAGDSTQASSSNPVGIYTETALSKISEMLNAPVSVSGSTPSITAKAGVRYVCGECSTLSITAPASGDVEVIFESGSTATVLTVPNTVRFPEWFDSTDLEANRTYDIIISNGTMGLVTSWAS